MDLAVAEFRNTRMQGQISPSKMLFGRRLRGEFPQLRMHLDIQEGVEMHEAKLKAYLGAGAETRPSEPLAIGEYVWVQDHMSGR